MGTLGETRLVRSHREGGGWVEVLLAPLLTLSAAAAHVGRVPDALAATRNERVLRVGRWRLAPRHADGRAVASLALACSRAVVMLQAHCAPVRTVFTASRAREDALRQSCAAGIRRAVGFERAAHLVESALAARVREKSEAASGSRVGRRSGGGRLRRLRGLAGEQPSGDHGSDKPSAQHGEDGTRSAATWSHPLAPRKAPAAAKIALLLLPSTAAWFFASPKSYAAASVS